MIAGRSMHRITDPLLPGLLLTACTSTDNLQLSNANGVNFTVGGTGYEQIWRAANAVMSHDMVIVKSHKPSGVIKSRVVKGTAGKVVGFFIQPTSENAPSYTITTMSQKPLQAEFVDRDQEPSVVADFRAALGFK